jgi:DNA repair protein RadC
MEICQIKNVKDLSDLGQLLLGKVDIGVHVVICLNARKDIIGINVAHIGSLKYLTVREVFKYAILSNAAAIAILHNHPSGGRITPSKEDVEITKKLIKAGKLLDIDVVDHLIITEGNHFSFLDKGICNFK